MKRRARLLLWTFVLTFTLSSTAITASSAAVPERHAAAGSRQSMTIIVYNGFALVRDVRRLNLERGENNVVFDDVSPQMAPETAYLSDLSSGAPIWVHEQNFETAVLSPDAIFSRTVGHSVLVIRTSPMTGQDTREKAIVLSTNGPILQFKDRIETSLPPNGRIAYTSIPSMRITPGFLADFDSSTAGERSIGLGYLTNGLSWSADYVSRLNAPGDRLNIDAFITLHNDSGMTFSNVAVRVVAGSVQRAAPPQAMTLGAVTTRAASNVYAASESRATREPVSEFYQYSLPQHTTLATGETKQTLLLFARDVPVRQIYAASSGANDFQTQSGDEQRLPVSATLEFANDGHGLGVPLPSGVFHMYKNDEYGEPVFIGEDAIDNTPKKELVDLSLGQSFDVTVRRVQTDYREVRYTNAPTHYITDYRVTVRNAKSRSIVLQYEEALNGQWQINSESLPHQKTSSSTVQWAIPVPAGGQTVLTFEVETR